MNVSRSVAVTTLNEWVIRSIQEIAKKFGFRIRFSTLSAKLEKLKKLFSI